LKIYNLKQLSDFIVFNININKQARTLLIEDHTA